VTDKFILHRDPFLTPSFSISFLSVSIIVIDPLTSHYSSSLVTTAPLLFFGQEAPDKRTHPFRLVLGPFHQIRREFHMHANLNAQAGNGAATLALWWRFW